MVMDHWPESEVLASTRRVLSKGCANIKTATDKENGALRKATVDGTA
jgi:hypothetical protein